MGRSSRETSNGTKGTHIREQACNVGGLSRMGRLPTSDLRLARKGHLLDLGQGIAPRLQSAIGCSYGPIRRECTSLMDPQHGKHLKYLLASSRSMNGRILAVLRQLELRKINDNCKMWPSGAHNIYTLCHVCRLHTPPMPRGERLSWASLFAL